MVGLSTRALHERGDVRSLFTYLDDEADWQAGEHVRICYAMVSTTHMVRATLEGLGARPPPVLRHVSRRFVARRDSPCTVVPANAVRRASAVAGCRPSKIGCPISAQPTVERLAFVTVSNDRTAADQDGRIGISARTACRRATTLASRLIVIVRIELSGRSERGDTTWTACTETSPVPTRATPASPRSRLALASHDEPCRDDDLHP
jgi:hypothetical protein